MTHEIFEQLRDRLVTPDAASWEVICGLFEALDDPVTQEAALAYVREHVQATRDAPMGWDASQRPLPIAWIERALAGEELPLLASLCGALVYRQLPSRWTSPEATARMVQVIAPLRLESFEVRGVQLGEGQAPSLFDALERAPLRRLELEYCRIDRLAVQRLAESSCISQLTHLGLSQNELWSANLMPLWQAPRLEQLRSLVAWGNHISPYGMLDLIRASHMERLEHLDLADNDLRMEGLSVLAHATHMQRLHTLNVRQNAITADGVSVLGEAKHLGALRRLILEVNPLGDKGARYLAQAWWLGRLEHLSVYRTQLGSEGLKALLEALEAAEPEPCMERLDLSENALGDEGAAALARTSGLWMLQHLRLIGCEIGDAGAKALADPIRLPLLRVLALERNPIGAAGQKALGALRERGVEVRL